MTNTEHTGTILIDGHPLNEGGLPIDMTIDLDPAGRARLIKALISGVTSIVVCGTFGELYTLNIRSIEGETLE